MRGRGWALAGLLAVLVLDVWWRCHTVGPSLRDRLGVNLYLVTGAEAEPLDCDEAVYAYIGKRLARGAVMYRDMTENKPPGGYWAFALAAAVGGSSELTVRLMPIPLVLGTIALVWWLALRLRGPGAAVLAALTYAVLSTDPFVYGNGANMEHLVNLAATGSLAAILSAWPRNGRARIFVAGVCLGAAALVKQVAALHGAVYATALLLRGSTSDGSGRRPRTFLDRGRDLLALAAGFLLVGGLAAAVLVGQGAGRAAYEDVFRYGPALATDTPVDPAAPPLPVRWVTGNADPSGHLPLPFGRTNYLVWWGTGSWPVWIAAVPSLFWLAFGRGADGDRRLVAAWTLSAWVQVALPRLFWAHYYLLPLPGIAVAVSVFLGDMLSRTRSKSTRSAWSALAALGVIVALGWTARIQVAEYLEVSPEELTIRDKGGRQWVVLRRLGRELANRGRVFRKPTLFVWGWQSPLFFYSGMDAVTPQLFADDLIKSFAGKDHPLIRPRVARMMSDLRADPPAVIFTGYPPFPELRAFLDERYFSSRLGPATSDGRGLWVEKSAYGAFEAAR